MIGIIGAMSVETEALKAKLTDKKTEVISGTEYVIGKLSGKDAVVAQCGIGKVFASVCAQTMILRYGVDTLINTGVAGTLTEELGVLDFAISDGVVQHDMDTTAIGDKPGLISGLDTVEIKASEKLMKAAVRLCRLQGNECVSGIIASGDQFINDKNKKAWIRNTFGAIACEMEGAAIGHVCRLSNVDFLIIRCISDNASGEAEMEYPRLVGIAAERSQKLVEAIVEEVG